MKCFFCTNDLDNSDEHIILNSLNGKLHSKEIICSECNNFFGAKLDSVAKDFFNPILFIT
ncbi:HNH endonuclease [uncultured Aquimarina sp.]|uniref:HNH endonuclease n=1 Tax=uncultured Aquimarina sp. TaxID=575652 RepID=UPI00345BC0DD